MSTGLSRGPETGDPRVDDALRSVEDLDEAPVDEHAERLSAAHGTLQEVLRTPTDPLAGAGPSPAPRP
ncbi:MAG: hypothetical protein ACRYG2_11230 [Janthinobacterium lividum]